MSSTTGQSQQSKEKSELALNRPWATPIQLPVAKKQADLGPMNRWLNQDIQEEPWHNINAVLSSSFEQDWTTDKPVKKNSSSTRAVQNMKL